MPLDSLASSCARGSPSEGDATTMGSQLCREDLASSGSSTSASLSQNDAQGGAVPWLSTELLHLLDGSHRRPEERDAPCCLCSMGEEANPTESIISSHTSSFNRSLHGSFFSAYVEGLTPCTTETTPTGYPSPLTAAATRSAMDAIASPTRPCPIHSSPTFSPPSVVFSYADVEEVLRRGARRTQRVNLPPALSTRDVGTTMSPSSPCGQGMKMNEEEDVNDAASSLHAASPRSATTPLTAMEAFMLWRSRGMPNESSRRRCRNDAPPPLYRWERPVPEEVPRHVGPCCTRELPSPNDINLADMMMGSCFGSGLDWLLPGHTIFRLLLLGCVFLCTSAVYVLSLVLLL